MSSTMRRAWLPLAPFVETLDGLWVQLVQQQMEDTMRAQEKMTRRLAALEHRPDLPVPEEATGQVRRHIRLTNGPAAVTL